VGRCHLLFIDSLMLKIELLVIGIGNQNGCFDSPESKSFSLKSPLLLRSYRPEKKCDSDHYRVFTSFGGGIKAACSDVAAKCSGKNHRLTPENTLKDLLAVYGFSDDRAARKILLFMQRSLKDTTITLSTKISWLLESKVEDPETCPTL
jgi:hypothetical protein